MRVICSETRCNLRRQCGGATVHDSSHCESCRREPSARCISADSYWLSQITPFFPKAFIYGNSELILDKTTNTYFLLGNVSTDLDFSCKILEFLSRPSFKGVSAYKQKMFRTGLNAIFGQSWTPKEIELIYTRLGNGVNRPLCETFIKNGMNLSLLGEVRDGKP